MGGKHTSVTESENVRFAFGVITITGLSIGIVTFTGAFST